MTVSERIRNIFLKNTGLKLAALFLALLAWLYFFAEREGISFRVGSAATFRVPIQVLSSPYLPRQASVFPDECLITVKGERDVISGLGPEDFSVFVEIRGLRKGEYFLPLRSSTRYPVEIISKNPANARVIVE